jgi:hypothetical protein
MRYLRIAAICGGLGLVVLAGAPSSAGPFLAGGVVQVSGASPIPAACLGDQPDSGTNHYNSEVEPWVWVDPGDPNVLIGTWQQDRWNNGGARGNVTATSPDGGATWALNANTKNSICTGGTPANGGNYERASDPWVSISPDGTAYLQSLSTDTNAGGSGTFPNAILVSRSTNSGATWDDPATLIRDTNPNIFNDKNSLTADPSDSDFAYAVWDRLQSPPGAPPTPRGWENAAAFTGAIYFSRTTNGGDSWEPAREIFNPGTIQQTIGNQIVVLPDTTQFEGDELIDFFDLIRNSNRHKTRGFSIALLRSDNRGAMWDRRTTIVDRHEIGVVRDPEDGSLVRTGDILPEPAVDPNSGALYVVWQDARFGPPSSVAFSQSLDGGRTWSPTVKINKTPNLPDDRNEQAFLPMVRVANDGTITVIYYDFRSNTADGAATTPTDVWAIHCHPTTPDRCADPANWEDEQRLTAASFDMRQMPVARGFFPGDYVGLGTDGTDFFPFWSQSHAGDQASIFVRRTGP